MVISDAREAVRDKAVNLDMLCCCDEVKDLCGDCASDANVVFFVVDLVVVDNCDRVEFFSDISNVGCEGVDFVRGTVVYNVT